MRIEKISAIIAGSKYGLHDISRTELDSSTGLPRFNMPFELGLFVGAKRFGGGRHKIKSCLILDVERYRYQKFISDIAGQDIAAHGGKPMDAIRHVRDWLSDSVGKTARLPGGAMLAGRYEAFRKQLADTCAELGLVPEHLTFNDYVIQVEEWLTLHPPRSS